MTHRLIWLPHAQRFFYRLDFIRPFRMLGKDWNVKPFNIGHAYWWVTRIMTFGLMGLITNLWIEFEKRRIDKMALSYRNSKPIVPDCKQCIVIPQRRPVNVGMITNMDHEDGKWGSYSEWRPNQIPLTHVDRQPKTVESFHDLRG